MATTTQQIGLTPEQQQERATGIGGSDMAAVLGVSRWKTARALYHEKRHSIREAGAWEALKMKGDPDDGLPAAQPQVSEYRLRMGHRMEDVLAAEYELETGNKTRRSNLTRRHPKLPFLVGNADRTITGARKGLEIKTVELYAARDWHSDDDDRTPIVPEYYEPQPVVYMAVFDYEAWDVYAGVSLVDAYLHPMRRDLELEEMVLDSASDFWQRVVAGEPPDFDYSHASTEKTLAQLYPGTNGQRIVLPQTAVHIAEAREHIRKEMNDLATTERTLSNSIGAMMGDAAQGILPRDQAGGFTRKAVTRSAYEVEQKTYTEMRYSARLGRSNGGK